MIIKYILFTHHYDQHSHLSTRTARSRSRPGYRSHLVRTPLPTLRYHTHHSGQINSINTLTTASETSTAKTDQTITYDTAIACTNFAQLKYGLSLMSY